MKMQIRTQQVGNGARDCASRTGFQVMLNLLVSGPYVRSKRLGDYFRKVLEPSVLNSPAWKWDSSGASLPASGCLKGKEARWCAGKALFAGGGLGVCPYAQTSGHANRATLPITSPGPEAGDLAGKDLSALSPVFAHS